MRLPSDWRCGSVIDINFMIEINLLPEESKKKQARWSQIDLSQASLQNMSLVHLGMIAGAAILGLQIVVFTIGFSTGHISAALEKRYARILPKKQEADAIKHNIEVMNRKIRTIDDLMVERFSWAKKLNDLSDAMTPYVWLTEISYDERSVERRTVLEQKGEAQQQRPVTTKALSRYLRLTGYASSVREEGAALVGKFIKNLKSSPGFYSDFSDIELGNVKAERFEDQEVMKFTITCYFKDK